MNRGFRIKKMQKAWKISDGDVLAAMKKDVAGRSIDTIRKLGRIHMSDEVLNNIEEGLQEARRKRQETLAQDMVS